MQAKYLSPDAMKVQELAALLEAKQIGVVAHFYMDPEVQGVLVAAKQFWPHIHISDSLVMADRAVSMANAGCKHIAVLGVDFMSENVRAILDRAGHEKVSCELLQIWRVACLICRLNCSIWNISTILRTQFHLSYAVKLVRVCAVSACCSCAYRLLSSVHLTCYCCWWDFGTAF